MSIPPRYLDELRNRLNLSDVIGKRVKVTRAGREFKACCPFHKEKTPSFTINDDKQFYHCFGCGAHGDVIGFVMQHDNLSFVDAVETLSAQAGLQMPKPDPESVQRAEKAKDLHSLLDEATNWFTDQLFAPGNAAILKYLEDRGLNRQTLAEFRVGFAPSDRQALRSYLKAEGYKDEQMIEAGLVKTSEKSSEPYVFFRERVMFPVADRRGRVVAFGGRIVPDHLRPPDRGDYKPAKYINSSETPVFDKGRMLYSESSARQAARDGQPIIVTEGYMDVIACHQAGFKGAVAPMGTALTEDQILSLWSMIPDDEKVPVLCFDGDNAGRSAASRACERVLPLLKPGQSIRFAFLPDGEDPDSLIRGGGRETFKKIINSGSSLFDFIWDTHMSGRSFETPEARAGVIKALESHVNEIADKDVQTHYRQILRDRVSETFFPRRGGKSGGAGARGRKPAMKALKVRRPAFKSKDISIKILMSTIISHPHVYDVVEEIFGQHAVENQRFDQLRQRIIHIINEEAGVDTQALQIHLKEAGFEKEMDDILNESVYVHAAFARPGYDSDLVATGLSTWLSEVESRDMSEYSSGWKEAFHHSNEDSEEKLRNMVKIRATDV